MIISKAYAQDRPDCETSDITYGDGGTVQSPVCIQSGQQLMSRSVSIILVIAVFITFAMLLYGGLKYTIAQGDQMKLAQAKGTITYAIIGLAVSFLSLFAWFIIGQIMGFNFF